MRPDRQGVDVYGAWQAPLLLAAECSQTVMHIKANPPRGEKGDFRKLSVTVPPEAYERLIRESVRRKIAGEPNHLVSALVREALIQYLERFEQ